MFKYIVYEKDANNEWTSRKETMSSNTLYTLMNGVTEYHFLLLMNKWNNQNRFCLTEFDRPSSIYVADLDK